MDLLGVTQVAEALGVTPRRVRQMLAAGSLSGSRVGRAWAIDADQVSKAKNHRPARGRPWHPASAWAVLALADGGEAVLTPVDRSRARQRLGDGLEDLAGSLRSRATVRTFYGHPSVLALLAAATDVVRSGISAAADHGADLLGGDGFEGYVRASDAGSLVSQLALDESAQRPNVVLRVVEDAVWPFQAGQRLAGRAVVAIDLLESADPRARRAATELLAAR
jgi:excisionase family DNA binding protein